MSKRWEFRDVSILLQTLRNFLLGRKHTLHQRFPSNVAPRSIPKPDIPRGPEYKYSKQYYYKRNAFDSVKPPIVAPVAECQPMRRDSVKSTSTSTTKPVSVSFTSLPTPGTPWLWDGHCYYECVPDQNNSCIQPPSEACDPKK
ncbi:hypothetical protein ACJJTC_017175 [Scirpophaga incertulas]